MKNFADALAVAKKNSLHRQLVDSDSIDAVTILRQGKKLISFCCNDYLALSHHPKVKAAAIAAIKEFGVGARASRYITGNNSLYGKLEKQIARWKKTDDAIVFSSGYASAIGTIPALVDQHDLIIADRLIHSSLIDGAKLSGARLMRFRHNDVEHCHKILNESRHKFRKCLIVTETVFSMDGDVGKVSKLLELAHQFDCFLLSDDAHGTATRKVESDVAHLQMGTLSKAVGALGGYVAGNKILIDYLRNFAKSAIYSTALPPAILAASSAALEIISKENLGQKSLENAEYFCRLMELPKPESSIVIIVLGDSKKVLEVAKEVSEKGFLISAIRPPTVEPKGARLRLTFSAAHQKQQINGLVKALKEVL